MAIIWSGTLKDHRAKMGSELGLRLRATPFLTGTSVTYWWHHLRAEDRSSMSQTSQEATEHSQDTVRGSQARHVPQQLRITDETRFSSLAPLSSPEQHPLRSSPKAQDVPMMAGKCTNTGALLAWVQRSNSTKENWEVNTHNSYRELEPACIGFFQMYLSTPQFCSFLNAAEIRTST